MKKIIATLLALGLVTAAGFVSADFDPTNDEAYMDNILDYND